MLKIGRSSLIPNVMIAILFFLTALTGCSSKVQIPDVSLLNQPDRYAADGKMDLNVGLALGGLYDDFRANKWEKKMADEKNRTALGEQLAKNAAELSCLLFNPVSAAKDPGLVDQSRQGLFLTPTIVAIETAVPSIRGDELKVMLAMEWKLEDRDKNLLWIDTVKGKANSLADGDFKLEDFNGSLLNDLFSKSFQALKSSPEIRKYAAQNRSAITEAGKDGMVSQGSGNSAEICSREIINRFRGQKTGKGNTSEK